MSDEMKNCCPPETKAPAMHAHDASSKTEDIKPKLITTAHKRLSQDEFQRKVAMAAYIKVAEDMGLSDMEKEAFLGALLNSARFAGRALPWMAQKAMQKAPSWLGKVMTPAMRAGGAAKGGISAGTWLNAPARAAASYGKYLLNPWSLAGTAAGVAGGALPYVGGALQRVGQAIGGTAGGGSGNLPGLGGAMGAGLLGAGLGGVAGALMPGEEEYEDENGNVRKRSRGMLAGALRGAGMGGLAGGAVGAGMDAYNSGAFKFGSAVAQLEKQAGPLSQMMPQPQSRGTIQHAPSMMQNIGTMANRFGAGLAAGAGGPAGAGVAAGAAAAKGLTSGAALGGVLGPAASAGKFLGKSMFGR